MIQRLRELRLRNFRQFGELDPIDLDADVVLIHGLNAAGKSSLLHAVEFALTRDVADLSRFEGSYPQCLTRRGSTSGTEVALTFLDAAGVERKQSASASVPVGRTAGRVTGNGPLQAGHVQHFRDRCYLSQTRLSRLLELYLATEPKRHEPPLIQFIRELLNLDALDRLEDGLGFLGNITTTRKTVSALAALQLQIVAAESAGSMLQAELPQRRQAFDAALERCQHLVAEWPQRDQSSETLWTPEAIERRQTIETNRLAADETRCRWLQEALEQVRQLRGEIDAAGLPNEEHLQQIISHVGELEVRRDVLLDILKSQLAQSAKALQFVGEEVSIDLSASAVEFEWSRCSALVSATLARLKADIAVDEAAEARRQELEESLKKLDVEWQDLSQRLMRDPSSTRSLLEALQVLIDQIVGETCPLCDREFSETGRGSLHAHIEGKLIAVRQEQSLLQSIVALRTQRESLQTQLDAQTETVRRSAETRRHAVPKVAALAKPAEGFEQLAPTFQQLREVSTQVREGDSQLRALDSGVERQAVWRRRLSEIEKRAGIESPRPGLDHEVGRDSRSTDASSVIPSDARTRRPFYGLGGRNDDQGPRPDLSLADHVASSETAIRAAYKRAPAVLLRHQQYVSALKSACDATTALSNIELQASQNAATQTQLDAAMKAAKKSIEAGKEVRKQAAIITADVFNQVFNETLNRLWRDLFERLVRNETFHPQLTAPKVSRNKLSVEMGAAVGGTLEFPDIGAIFSTGNLNTAALSLFLALNLVEESQHRLLILDDPVQNMDDVHVMQLAAVLKTIGRDRQHGRQLFLATHDRSLFEYLQIELGPTQAGESLITIGLERSPESAQSSVTVERFEWSDDSLRFRAADG